MKVARFICSTCGQKCVWFRERIGGLKQCADCIREDAAGELAEIRRAKELSGAPG